jgi:hypothetical protein
LTGKTVKPKVLSDVEVLVKDSDRIIANKDNC